MFTPFAFIQPFVPGILIPGVPDYLYVGGGFTTYGQPVYTRILRTDLSGSVDTSFNINTGPHNNNPIDDVAQLNHYFVKTKEEFINKINRGRADNGGTRTIEDFEPHNANEIDDYNALNFFKK
jgi:hypothetical protein